MPIPTNKLMLSPSRFGGTFAEGSRAIITPDRHITYLGETVKPVVLEDLLDNAIANVMPNEYADNETEFCYRVRFESLTGKPLRMQFFEMPDSDSCLYDLVVTKTDPNACGSLDYFDNNPIDEDCNVSAFPDNLPRATLPVLGAGLNVSQGGTTTILNIPDAMLYPGIMFMVDYSAIDNPDLSGYDNAQSFITFAQPSGVGGVTHHNFNTLENGIYVSPDAATAQGLITIDVKRMITRNTPQLAMFFSGTYFKIMSKPVADQSELHFVDHPKYERLPVVVDPPDEPLTFNDADSSIGYPCANLKETLKNLLALKSYDWFLFGTVEGATGKTIRPYSANPVYTRLVITNPLNGNVYEWTLSEDSSVAKGATADSPHGDLVGTNYAIMLKQAEPGVVGEIAVRGYIRNRYPINADVAPQGLPRS